jgi:DNA polymerase-1
MSEKTLLLVDGSSYLYRAYHALPDLRSADQFPTGAIHGIVGMMRWLRDHYPCEHAVCVFDAKGKTFRDDWYAEYKANRAAMPDDLVRQIEPIHEVVQLLGWPVLEVPGVEADDAIGTLARIGSAAGHRVIISTGDKDLAQLVSPRVCLINTMARPPEMLDEAGVLAKFGVPPQRIVDYLSLIGDAVDNVPGVDKVGPKTAAKWINEYGTLDGVIAAAGGIKGAVGDNLRKSLDWLPQGRRLITVRTDCDLAQQISGWPALDALSLREVDRPGLQAFFERYDFRTFRKELEQGPFTKRPAGDAEPSAVAQADAPAASPVEAALDHETIVDWPRFEHWLEQIRRAETVSLGIQTDSLDGMVARIVGISFAVGPGAAAYVPLGHDYPGAPEQLPRDELLSRLKPWLEDPAAAKLGQNIKYDLHVFANHGIAVRGYAHDIVLESYVLEAHKPHGLQSLAERHLGRSAPSYEALCGKGAQQIAFAQVDVHCAGEYSGGSSEMALQVHRTLWPRIDGDDKLRFVYQRIEMPTSAVLERIERNGVLIDAQLLARQSKALGERMMALEQEAYSLAGQPFNLGSPKQIGEILFGKLGLTALKKTASGAPSTDEAVLEKLAEDHPLPRRMLDHRSLSKLKSTYTDKLPSMVNPHTGRVHTTYGQAVAITGRLASNEPNLQNIPIRTAEGRRIREAFIASPGHVIVSADYSQIELRLMAHISADPNLLRAFADGTDVHCATASEVFSVPLGEVSSEQRRYAKTINFGLIYGMGAFGLATALGIEQKAARDYLDRYFARLRAAPSVNRPP